MARERRGSSSIRGKHSIPLLRGCSGWGRFVKSVTHSTCVLGHGDIGCPAACSRPPSSSTAWKSAGVGSQTCLVSDDAAIDAQRTRSLQPPPRFRIFADHAAHSRAIVNTQPSTPQEAARPELCRRTNPLRASQDEPRDAEVGAPPSLNAPPTSYDPSGGSTRLAPPDVLAGYGFRSAALRRSASRMRRIAPAC